MAITIEHTTSIKPTRLTLDDIARHVGIGRATVAHVMAGRADRLRIAKATQERVRQAADALGYIPNSAAKAMAQGRVGRIAMVIGSYGRTLSLGMIIHATRALSAQGMTLSIAEVPDEKLSSDEYMPRILQELSADGLIIAYNAAIPAEMSRVILANSIPTVWINTKRPNDCTYPDELAGGRRAVNLLLEAGHRKIAYIGFADANHFSAIDRLQGCADAMAAAGLQLRRWDLPKRFYEPDELSSDNRLEHCLRFLSAADRPTAVVCYERHAIEPLQLAAAQLGLSVPRDLSIVGFHENPVNGTGVPVTTLMVPTPGMGDAAVKVLSAKLANRTSCGEPSVAVPYTEMFGHTVVPPPSTGTAP